MVSPPASQVGHSGSIPDTTKELWPYRIVVSPSGFQSEHPGSIPGTAI